MAKQFKESETLEKKSRQPSSTVETQIAPTPREWWPYSRRQQFSELQTLINETCTINNGSSALERITRCIELAMKLNAWRREDDGRTPSFVRFLEEEMFKGEKPKAEAPSVPSATDKHLAAPNKP